MERAIEGGFRIFGFSDHTPQPFPGQYVSSVRMSLSELEGYCDTVLDLKREYRGQIEILLGLEAEYYPDLFPELCDFLKDYPIEYLLLGQHWTAGEPLGVISGRPTEEEAVIETYVEECIAALSTGRFLYLAHPDLINYVGPEEVYDRYMLRLCEAAKSLSVPLEINLLGMEYGRHYPNSHFWSLVGKVGNQVIIGTDAHHVENVFRPDQVKRAYEELIRPCGLNIIPGNVLEIGSVKKEGSC